MMQNGRLARPAGWGRPASTNHDTIHEIACAFPVTGATIRSSEGGQF